MTIIGSGTWLCGCRISNWLCGCGSLRSGSGMWLYGFMALWLCGQWILVALWLGDLLVWRCSVYSERFL